MLVGITRSIRRLGIQKVQIPLNEDALLPPLRPIDRALNQNAHRPRQLLPPRIRCALPLPQPLQHNQQIHLRRSHRVQQRQRRHPLAVRPNKQVPSVNLHSKRPLHHLRSKGSPLRHPVQASLLIPKIVSRKVGRRIMRASRARSWKIFPTSSAGSRRSAHVPPWCAAPPWAPISWPRPRHPPMRTRNACSAFVTRT